MYNNCKERQRPLKKGRRGEGGKGKGWVAGPEMTV
jgi:hypothetical protein